ncbi:MAG TPA: SUMF1/EgtB/PvdO family nonheme iron enzyme, partial [Fibrobacteria bacterium]|nr:SUMF1/EgtB/PvdO family nonheme iron enzyme [Fibrobacteria bacterium]
KDVGDTVTVFRLTERFLPPGKEYLLRLTAMDTSNYVSHEDTLRVATRAIRFTGADSSLACPPGFIPIPRARFTLGDLNAVRQKPSNEQGKAVTMAAFCIEPYEHRDSAGRFVTKVTWEEAQATCEAISKDHGTALCTEAEWERACEGFDISNPHLHGIQRELDPSILQTRCNQGSGDVAMAMSLELRNPVCLTNEGVHDMTGNLSEWVRDVYFDSAYRYMGDTLGHDDVAKAPVGRPNGVRGGNFLAPTRLTSQATLLAHARCNNRDFAMQVRPVFRKDCVDSLPRIAVQYAGSGLGSHRCISIPDSLRGRPFTDVIPTLGDTTGTRLTLFEAGTNKAHQVVIPPDTAFRGRKPLEARITTLSVAEVLFDRVGTVKDSVVDTLETSEMRDTSQATLEYILKRESPSASWQPRKVDGRYYIRRLYAYATLGSKNGREHYASPTLGFRCCARPLPSASSAPSGP